MVVYLLTRKEAKKEFAHIPSKERGLEYLGLLADGLY